MKQILEEKNPTKKREYCFGGQWLRNIRVQNNRYKPEVQFNWVYYSLFNVTQRHNAKTFNS